MSDIDQLVPTANDGGVEPEAGGDVVPEMPPPEPDQPNDGLGVGETIGIGVRIISKLTFVQKVVFGLISIF